MVTTKVDLLRESRQLYVPSRRPALVEVPEFQFLMIDGHGDPETSTQTAIPALFGAAYRLKFAMRRSAGIDYKVLPLEGLWWTAGMTSFSTAHKAELDWTLMIRQPDEVDEQLLAQVEPSAEMRLERWQEGLAAQIMHIGPYSAEGPTVAALHEFIAAEGLQPAGKHHEIYIGDPSRAAPEKLKTVLRQPVRPR